jgi:hypothetical protein
MLVEEYGATRGGLLSYEASKSVRANSPCKLHERGIRALMERKRFHSLMGIKSSGEYDLQELTSVLTLARFRFFRVIETSSERTFGLVLER